MRMYEIQCSQHLIDIFSGCNIAKATTSSFQFFQHRVLQIFKDQEKSFFPSKHFDHIDEILVTQFLNRETKNEQLNLNVKFYYIFSTEFVRHICVCRNILLFVQPCDGKRNEIQPAHSYAKFQFYLNLNGFGNQKFEAP